MAGVLVAQREVLDPLREVAPRRDPRRLRFRIVLRVRPLPERPQRTTGAVDLGHFAAQLRGHHHAEVPRIMRREILEHRALLPGYRFTRATRIASSTIRPLLTTTRPSSSIEQSRIGTS